ncbi:MAG: hypothetical protein V7771_09815 [Shewanella psychromarinicola]|jgi:hypothetical protein|uniref:hypothetical protein n=1 Tax=Shewanella TaxID=22 RepID=UPI00300264A8
MALLTLSKSVFYALILLLSQVPSLPYGIDLPLTKALSSLNASVYALGFMAIDPLMTDKYTNKNDQQWWLEQPSAFLCLLLAT